MRYMAVLLLLALAMTAGCGDSTTPMESTRSLQSPSGSETQRSIDEFVSAQGTWCFDDGMGGCILFVPPLDNFLGWVDPSNGHAAAVDYAGVANRWLEDMSGGSMSFGTSFTGTVVEQPMMDGRARVRVNLHTRNALTWVAAGGDFNGPLLFGVRVTDVWDSGAVPALGASVMSFDFANTAPGAPLPDLMQLLISPEPGQEIYGASIVLNTAGALREASGWAEGTPGRVRITEVGLLGLPGGAYNGHDGFPVESIQLLPIGNLGGRPGETVD